MPQFPTEFAKKSEMLPTDIGERGNLALTALRARGFEVKTGLTHAAAQALAKQVSQRGSHSYHPDDAVRFRTPAAILEWMQKQDNAGESGRRMYLLMQRQGDSVSRLAGHGWTGPKADRDSGGNTTVAVRIGHADQDTSDLWTNFATTIVCGTAALQGADGFWLRTWQSDTDIVDAAHAAGFEDAFARPINRLKGRDDDHRLLGHPDVRITMTYPNRLLPPAIGSTAIAGI